MPVVPLGFWPFRPNSRRLHFFPFLRNPRTLAARTKPPERRATMYRLFRRSFSMAAEGSAAAASSSPPPSTSMSSTPRQHLPDELYRRIMNVGRPSIPLSPVLEQWNQEGHTVKKFVIQAIVKKLVGLRRFAHALEVPGKPSSPLNLRTPQIAFFLRFSLISHAHSAR